MNTAEVLSYLDLLEDNLDGLEEGIDDLLPSESLAEASKKLPLLDRAKLHVTIVYAIESLLFSYLRLHNISPHSHPVFKELARVKSYFDKIKDIDKVSAAPAQKRDFGLDKQAAGRFIKHALAGNHKIDLEAAERKAKEALLAKRKLRLLEKQLSLSDSEPVTPVPSSDPAVLPETDVGDMEEGEIEDEAQVEQPQQQQEDEEQEEGIEEGELAEDVHVIPAEIETPTKSKKQNKTSKKAKKRQRQRQAEMVEASTPKKKKKKHSSLTAVHQPT